MIIKINPDVTYQTYESMGASGAWWAQIVGGWNHIDAQSGLEVRDRISQLLYSKDKGIGMQVYRYNIGAGSKHSGRGEYSQPARSTECFETAPYEYDWSRDANAVYMMEQAVRDGADEIILFVNSPIERLTKNHMAHANKGKLFRENISRENYKDFARYCCDVAEHFIEKGLPVKYLSPVNEPLWIWNGGQEGCHYKPKSVTKIFKVFAQELSKRPNLKKLKLSGTESGDVRWFNKSYTRALLKNSEVRKYIDAVDIHSYCLPVPVPFNVPFLNNRTAYVKRFRRWMDRKYPGMPVKMSEWTHMKGGRDKGMDSALVAAKTIYEDFTLLNAVSWQHWIAVSEVDYCDGLIYINLEDKTFEVTKRLYVTGNFSKYIQPGSVRIDAQSGCEDLLTLAFKKESEIVVMAINLSSEVKKVSLPAKGDVICAVTDKDNDLIQTVRNGTDITVNPKSVNTFCYFE